MRIWNLPGLIQFTIRFDSVKICEPISAISQIPMSDKDLPESRPGKLRGQTLAKNKKKCFKFVSKITDQLSFFL